MDDIIKEVIAEVNRAQKLYPRWPDDPLHAVAILGEEYGELVQAILQTTYESPRATVYDVELEAIQVAAMAIRFLLSIDKYNFEQSNDHDQLA